MSADDAKSPYGILVVDKPIGATSHDVVAMLRKRLGTKRIGHAGTLDPLATGVLVVAVGPATRFLQYLPLEPKEYVATVRFGVSTASYDAEGDITAERPVPSDLRIQIEAALPNFLGLQDQLPPMFSAVKIGGRPLYDYARRGHEIERRPRTIHVGTYEIVESGSTVPVECIQYHPGREKSSQEGLATGTVAETLDRDGQATMVFRIVCSGGTYVRTLAHDLGEAVGTGAHLTALRRTRVGVYDLSHAVTVEEVSRERLLPLAEALDHLPSRLLTPDEAISARHGRDLPLEVEMEGKNLLLLARPGEVLGMAIVEGRLAHPECVIPAEVS